MVTAQAITGRDTPQALPIAATAIGTSASGREGGREGRGEEGGRRLERKAKT